jgi:hypothetical protein
VLDPAQDVIGKLSGTCFEQVPFYVRNMMHLERPYRKQENSL